MGLAWTPRERAGTLGAGRGGSWESLKDPSKGSCWCKTLHGAMELEGEALCRKGRDSWSPTSLEGGAGSYFLGLRRLNTNDPPGGSGTSPFPPRVPMSDPNRPQPQSKALPGLLPRLFPRGEALALLRDSSPNLGRGCCPHPQAQVGESGKEGE